MNDVDLVLTGLLSMLGVVVGASVQYWLSRASDRRKQSEELRNQAYADYLRAVAELGAAHQHGVTDTSNLSAELIGAKTRIAIYGTTAAVRALARFEAEGAVLDADERRSTFLDLCRTMRGDSAVGEPLVSSTDLRRVLFGRKGARD